METQDAAVTPPPHPREPVTTAYLSHLQPCSFAAYLANKLQEQKKEGRMGGKVGKKAECRSFETGTRMLLAILSLSHARVCVCVCACWSILCRTYRAESHNARACRSPAMADCDGELSLLLARGLGYLQAAH